MDGARPGDDRLAADGGERAPGGDAADLQLPETASGEEAAAIAAAIESYLAAERAAAEGQADDERSWHGRRWTFAGRLATLTGRAARVPEAAPRDGWAAAGRADRF